jgi:hypothetical protein
MKRLIRILSIALLMMAGLVGSSLPAGAEDKCDRNIHKAEQKLRDAVEKHGEHSKQAEKRRHELEDVKHRCGDRHDHDMDHH